LQVTESNLNALIQGRKQFQVPLYQRQYTWRTPQLDQLWADVLGQYDALTPDEPGGKLTQSPAHFLGSMVLAPSPSSAAGVTSYLVIDGQQRLTTVLIALCALRDHAAVVDTDVIERINELYLVNKFDKGLPHYRLLPTQSDRDAFISSIKREAAQQSGPIGDAYRFFRAKLTQLGPDSEPLNVARLETVISERLQFVAITTDQNDNVHRIFESLNDRGVRLTQADLLRNYIFMLLPTKADEIYEEVWRPMQDSLTSNQLETLVFVDLVLRGYSTIKRPDIYRTQQDRLRPLEHNEAAIEAEVRELQRRSVLFRHLVQPETEPNALVRAALQRLDRWEASTTYPLLMHVYQQWHAGACSESAVVNALSYIESFLVRRMIVGVPNNNLNRIFNSLVPLIPPESPLAEGIQHALSGERKYWPTDRRLREAFRTQPFYFQGRQEQKMVIFERLEDSFKNPEPVNWAAANLTVEHIMPQTLTDEWRAAILADGDDPEEVHAQLLHTLGNLTITASNPELSNNPFERKQQILERSHLALNRAILPKGKWGQGEILARADELADRAIDIWPGPVPGVVEMNAGKDWSALHAALAILPLGTWTTYGDLAELVSSHANPVGQHLATTRGILNAHRVLTSEGRVSQGFFWLDPEEVRDVREVLESEGIRFNADERADPEQRIRADELAILLGDIVEPVVPLDADADWQWRRLLRYLSHFYDAPNGRLHEDIARTLATQDGYDPRGVAGFYRGAGASLRREGDLRILTDAGRQLYEEHRHRLE